MIILLNRKKTLTRKHNVLKPCWVGNQQVSLAAIPNTEPSDRSETTVHDFSRQEL